MIGSQFGRWTVIGEPVKNPKGERKWLCRCTCGTERYVLERSLRSGGSLSCGCLRREEAFRANFRDLTGKTFGELTVLSLEDTKDSNRNRQWRCHCSCGAEYVTAGTLLTSGQRTHCPSRIHRMDSTAKDVTGMRFHSLTALYPTSRRDSRGFVIWHCRCDCGNTVDVSYNSLCYSNLKSCGCRKKDHNQKLANYLVHVDGTSIDIIRSKKIPSNNTTGCKGVYFIRGQYVAKIVFQKKAYYLGHFDRIEDAVHARKRAEAVLFDEVASYYEQFQEAARRDPDWAKANPFQVFVAQNADRDLSVSFAPALMETNSRMHQGAAD